MYDDKDKLYAILNVLSKNFDIEIAKFIIKQFNLSQSKVDEIKKNIKILMFDKYLTVL